MKLDRSTTGTSFAFTANRLCAITMGSFVAVLACGCSTSTSVGRAPQNAIVSNAVDTTNLMSAELAAPAPKVGKAHLAIDEADIDATTQLGLDESAPKEARRSDGSHRSGSFGTFAK